MGVRGVSDAQKEYQFFVNLNELLKNFTKFARFAIDLFFEEILLTLIYW